MQKRAWGLGRSEARKGKAGRAALGVCFAVSYASQVPRLCEPTQKKRHRVKLLFSARAAYVARSYDGGFNPRDEFSFCDCFAVCYCLEGNSKSSG